MAYVDLDRRFGVPGEYDLDDGSVQAWLRSYGSKSWDDVLKNRFVVILGNAGVGKSTEMQAQARRLRASGGHAVYAEFHSMAEESDFEHSLDAANGDAFRRWRHSGQSATFFLDAVDEARAASSAAFMKSLRSFVRSVKGAGENIRIVFSSRPTGWEDDEDIERLQATLSSLVPNFQLAVGDEVTGEPDPDDPSTMTAIRTAVDGATNGAIPIATFALFPLDDRQVRLLTPVFGVTDLESFMRALATHDVQFLAERPRDVEWLAEYWLRHHQITSMSEMLNDSVNGHLRERNPGRLRIDRLRVLDNRSAAERIAAATYLCRLTSIKGPTSRQQDGGDALRSTDLLPDWSGEEMTALLSRSLFEPSLPGRMRIHHRTTRSYLAACWILKLLDNDCPINAAADLVIGTAFGERRVIPSRAEVGAWVASADQRLRGRMIDAAPEIVLLYGDARRIPPEDRLRALRAFATRFQEVRRLGHIVSDADYARIADHSIDPAIGELIRGHETSSLVRRFLLNVARVGMLPASATAALEFARDPGRDPDATVQAVATVGVAGTRAEKDALWAAAQAVTDPENRYLAVLGQSLFPGVISMDALFGLLDRMQPPGDDVVGGPRAVVTEDWVDNCPAANRVEMLERLLSLATSPPLAAGRPHSLLSERYGWLVDGVARCARLVLETMGPQSPVPPPMTAALLLIQRLDRHDRMRPRDAGALPDLLSTRDSTRQALLAATVLGADEDPWRPILSLAQRRILQPLEPDISMAVVQAAAADSAEMQRRWLNAAIDVWVINQRPAGRVAEIVGAIAASGLEETERDVLLTWFSPERQPSLAETSNHAAEQQRERDQEERRFLEERADRIRSGTDLRALSHIVSLMASAGDGSSSRYGQRNIGEIEHRFGPEVASAAREGLIQCWRRWEPPLPSARGDGSNTEIGVVLGLTGLALLEAEGFDFSGLSAEEARLATLYALRELNRFPEWLAALAIRWPEVIANTITPEVAYELGPNATGEPRTLQSVAEVPAIAAAMAETILTTVSTSSALGPTALKASLRVLDQSTIGRGDLASLFGRRAEEVWASQTAGAYAWLRGWMQVDVHQAWDFLEAHLSPADTTAREQLSDLMLQLYNDVDEDDGVKTQYLRNPSWLLRAIPLIYRHFPVENDAHRAGIHRITISDRVLRVRGKIGSFLETIPGQAAHDALEALSRDRSLGGARIYFREGSLRHLEMSVEPQAWREADVAAFETQYERDPRNGAELYLLVRSRLSDIRADFEKGDFGDRGIFPNGVREEIVQRYFAGRLAGGSRRRFDVVREEEVADHKEPDIRIRSAVAGIVSIEIKPIDKKRYTFLSLVETLRAQLIGQYMRTARSRYGVLLLCLCVKPRKWLLENPRRYVQFDELVGLLQAEADAIRLGDPDVDGLLVVGIDASPWSNGS
ncbi:ATP-binding protein [Mycobacterium sp. KBS0706]|uniref:ATP-binding protein n=1 Tax=Mycobacterium sp. KBS0706 TaxID=2578109 RepID=UPI00110F9F4D|nr:ATP-binding protein [Mycobacterium sp. KBS0706]TSD87551.1 ATP-binding protein [Mycobacterium sp. KBS0706]